MWSFDARYPEAYAQANESTVIANAAFGVAGATAVTALVLFIIELASD